MAGKSTLLSLITGDHPQGYSNDLILFGRRRGSGETIWDIKKHIGYVSNSLHLDYRVSTTVCNVFHSLSWGQQRLALIVRTLLKHPTLLILDEPSQGLDSLNRQLIRRFIDELIGEGETQLRKETS